MSNFSYVNTAYKLPDDLGTLYAGEHYANRADRGDGGTLGGLLGADIPINEKKLHLMADWVVSRNDLGVAVVGGVVYTAEELAGLARGRTAQPPQRQQVRGGGRVDLRAGWGQLTGLGP